MQAAMLNMLKVLLMRPATEMEYLMSLGLGGLAAVLVMSKVGTAMDLKVAEPLRALMALGITLAAVLAALVLVDEKVRLTGWVILGVSVVVVLVIGVPAVCLIEKGGYVAGLVTLAMSIVVAAVVVVFVHTGFRAVRGGEKSVGFGLEHNRETKEFIK